MYLQDLSRPFAITDTIMLKSHVDKSTTTAEGKNYELISVVLSAGLNLVSAILNILSLIFKKKALQRLQHRGATRAGDGGYGYLKDRVWWDGLLTMAAGDVATFVQYIFFSAEMVTYLGSFTFIICAILFCIFGNVLNVRENVSSVLSILCIYHLDIFGPTDKEFTSVQEMTEKLLKPGLLVYVLLVLVVVAKLIWIAAPRYRRTHILVYLSICSLLGVFTILFAKALAIVLKSGVHDSAFLKLVPWILTFLVSKVVQEIYLNKSLDLYNTQKVNLIYYMLFRSVALCTSLILFPESNSISTPKVAGMVLFLVGFVLGIFMLNDFESLDAESPPSSARCLRRPGAATGRSYSGSGG